MTIMYKLVEQDNTTRGGMTWAIGRTNVATGRGNELCTSGVLHCYSSPYLAVLFNPIHGDKHNPILYKIECSPAVDGDGLKFATKRQTPVARMQLPIFTKEQRVAFAIKCALLVFKDGKFVRWAESWLSGTDRSESAARSAAESARSAAESAARSAAWSAAESAAESAAWSAARSAAESAAWSAARSAESAESAARSARSADWSAESAAWSARSAESAAWSARSAESAAWSAESAARSAAWSARSAESAAWSAAAIFDGIARWVLDNIS